MKTILKLFTAIFFVMLASSIYAQEEVVSIINYTPNTNFIAFKIKNAKELKAGLENHPLKSLLHHDKAKEILDETLGIFDKEDVDVSIKEIEKKAIDKLFTSFNGEVYFTLSYHPTEAGKNDPRPKLISALVAQVDATPFQAFIKNGTKYADKSIGQKTISEQAHENIEYTSLRVSDDLLGNAFATNINGIGIFSNDEETFKKMITAISKKTAYANGLKSNEKIVSYFNSNQNKDILFMADITPLFKNEIAKNTAGIPKLLELLKADKLFQINATFDFDEKADSFDISLNCLDDGFLQLATFTNSEFTPSPFIGADVSAYSKVFFSVNEFKKKLFELLIKRLPELNHQELLKIIKTDYQIDADAFSDSIGDDYEGFSTLNKEGAEECLFVNKPKNLAIFTSNLSSSFNNPALKKAPNPKFTITENKDGSNLAWVFSFNTSDPNVKEDKFSLGIAESYSLFSMPGNITKKNMAHLKNSVENKLSSSTAFTAARALYPAKVALFSFAITKDLLTILKQKAKSEQAMISAIHPNLEKFLVILEEINAEDFKGNLSHGLWKEPNKLSFSIKLINK